ncbi:WW domain-binding protein 1-like [Heptranchias perlo]|uniref:WW domain-binding protein 1-like n=1 Tax=Heptranchias perlo TaxID=212740 RepID=UPI00355A47C0
MDAGWTRSVGPRAESQRGPGLLPNHNLTTANRSSGPRAAPHSQQARELCPGINNQRYWCETGHCCGETGCCTYYYELWWFWLLWTILLLFSCCCVYRHRRAKLRIQQQQRQREINLIAYHGACNYPPSPLDRGLLASFKLPAYEEVTAHPSTPPPPYSSLQRQAIGGELSPSPSSDHCTSCSCGSISPSGTSYSAQVTDTSDPATPSDGDPGPPQSGGASLSGSESNALSGSVAKDVAAAPTTVSRHAVFSSDVDLFEGSCQQWEEVEEEEEEEEEEEGGGEEEEEEEEGEEPHSRHRRLTGDSGIEVCRCQVDGDDSEEDCGEESGHFLHDSAGCAGRLREPLPQPADPASLCPRRVAMETPAPMFPV